MRTSDLYNSRAIALMHTEAASNREAYLGEGFFPVQKQTGLDLTWFKNHKGLPVSLKPSAFDTKVTIRSRQGISKTQTEMPYFKESYLLKESDEREIMRIQNSTDPYAQEVVDRIYRDAEDLIEGAMVVPERMRMSLLASASGNPSISIAADGVTYAYNYDPDDSYKTNNFLDLTTGDDSANNVWTNHTSSDPIEDVQQGIDAVEGLTGTKPNVLIVSKATMKHLRLNAKVKAHVLATNTNANIIMTDARVKEVFKDLLDVSIVVYTKKYKDETGTEKQFYPDGMATLVPNGKLGNTFMSITPEERTLMQKPDADVSIVNTGVAVTVTISDDPVQTQTKVSEIVLPSFERMDETFQIKAYTVA